jgi:hypothetical protein
VVNAWQTRGKCVVIGDYPMVLANRTTKSSREQAFGSFQGDFLTLHFLVA